jgi:hypothetical protein
MDMKRIVWWWLLLVCQKVMAQSPLFFIDQLEGDVQVVKAGSKNAGTASINLLLYPEDRLLLNKEGVKCKLAGRNNNHIVLTRKGSYKVSDITKMPFVESSSILSKYYQLLWEELLQTSVGGGTGRKDDLRDYWKNSKRGICSAIQEPLDKTITDDAIVYFTWPKMGATQQYRFSLFDPKGSLLYQFIVKDTFLGINHKNFIRQPQNSYLWQVESEEKSGNKTCQYLLNWVTSAEYKRWTDELIHGVKEESLTHHNLMVCQVLAENGFYKLANYYFKNTFVKDQDK